MWWNRWTSYKASAVLTIKYCWNDGTVQRASGKSGFGTGGILGLNLDKAIVNITKTKNTGTVTASARFVGGIVGLGRIPATNVISDCYNSGNITGSAAAETGLISGVNRNAISNCEVDINATANGVAASSLTSFVYGSQNNGGTTDTDSCRIITPKEVTFTINYGTNVGEAVYLTGAFCGWVADNRYALTWTAGNNWTGTFTFAVGDTISFKFIIAADEYDPASVIRWENDPNRSLTIAADTPAQNLSWQG